MPAFHITIVQKLVNQLPHKFTTRRNYWHFLLILVGNLHPFPTPTSPFRSTGLQPFTSPHFSYFIFLRLLSFIFIENIFFLENAFLLEMIQGLEKSRLALSGLTFKFHLITCIRLSLISDVGFIFHPNYKVKNLLPHFTPITFCQKFSWIFKAILFSLSLKNLPCFVSTMFISPSPPKSSNSLSNLSFTSASLFSFFFLLHTLLKFHCFFSRIAFFVFEVQKLLLTFWFFSKIKGFAQFFFFDNLSLTRFISNILNVTFIFRSMSFGFNFIRPSNIPKSLSAINICCCYTLGFLY